MSDFSQLESALGYTFDDQKLLVQALTHPSALRQNDRSQFERLEFLGDRVLGLSIAENLYKRFPKDVEGDLAKRLAVLVSRDTLFKVAETLSLKDYVSAYQQDLSVRSSILVDAAEAIIGAIFLDKGYSVASQIVIQLWEEHLQHSKVPPRDPKTALQEWAQGNGHPIPKYTTISEEGPAHEPIFVIELEVESCPALRATGHSKRRAAQLAAEKMLEYIKQEKK